MRRYIRPTGKPCADKPTVVIARSVNHEDTYERHEAARIANVTASNTWGGVTVDILTSTSGDPKYGGIVLRFKGFGSCEGHCDDNFIPHAVETPEGCEVHVAGGDEQRAVLSALWEALQRLHAQGRIDTPDMLTLRTP